MTKYLPSILLILLCLGSLSGLGWLLDNIEHIDSWLGLPAFMLSWTGMIFAGGAAFLWWPR